MSEAHQSTLHFPKLHRRFVSPTAISPTTIDSKIQRQTTTEAEAWFSRRRTRPIRRANPFSGSPNPRLLRAHLEPGYVRICFPRCGAFWSAEDCV